MEPCSPVFTIDGRSRFPRPDFIREHWESLDGVWAFSFDQPVFDREITVPFCYQSEKSGIGETADHEEVWYRRTFSVSQKDLTGRLLLHFGAVDYQARVWVNDRPAGEHTGGHVPFALDITELVQDGENCLTVQAIDRTDPAQPRGKQTWIGKRFGCWYTPTTGIWQSVWLEYAGENPILRAKLTPDLKNRTARCEVFLSKPQDCYVTVTLENREKGLFLGEQKILCKNGRGQAGFAFPDWDLCRHEILWSPDNPNLIDVTLCAEGGDRVLTYFGMREFRADKGRFLLNGDDLYLRMVLDQGYWKESLLTPPDGDALRRDIELTKAMGFNGARKHQKIEDPRYYYWADRLGLLVWGELPSAYEFTDPAMQRSAGELMDFVARDYNHPCIIAWVPVNESWGVRGVLDGSREQAFCRALYWLLKSVDGTRLVSSNDGWEQVTETDICAVHDYALFETTEGKYEDMEKALSQAVQGRMLYADGNRWQGQPVMMTEYGGIAFAGGNEESWGYYGKVRDQQEFMARLEPVNRFLIRSGKFAGFCYTQLTDVMQETNGLLTEDRQPKLPPEELKKTFGLPVYGL